MSEGLKFLAPGVRVAGSAKLCISGRVDPDTKRATPDDACMVSNPTQGSHCQPREPDLNVHIREQKAFDAMG
jgi:hypothetical protein